MTEAFSTDKQPASHDQQCTVYCSACCKACAAQRVMCKGCDQQKCGLFEHAKLNLKVMLCASMADAVYLNMAAAAKHHS
jgi:hypothetical protein